MQCNSRFVAVVGILVMAFFGSMAQTKEPLRKDISPCADISHGDHPKEKLSNGKLDVVVFLPDKDNGYYRSTRFDWSGLVPCVSLAVTNSSGNGSVNMIL